MDYEKKYKEALEKTKQIITDYQYDEHDNPFMEIFPELKENEDDEIRKSIIAIITNYVDNSNTFKPKMIAWLERQCQTFTKKDVDDAYLKGVCDTKHELEKQGEQKTVNLVTILDDYFANTPKEQQDKDWEELKHLNNFGWILVGQKPAENKGMNLVEEEMTPFQKKVFCIIDTTIEEEQGLKQVCDELLALASNEIKQKPAWSEEDKRKIDRIYSLLQQAADTHAFSTSCRLIGDKECIELQDFLKSLKDRVQPHNMWKPSDEQMLAINTAINVLGKGTINGKYLIELHEQLKKLREE